MPLASAFRPTCNLSSALAPLGRKNSLSQHFFIQKSKTCHETVEFTSQWGENIKNYSWATMPQASAFTPTCNISPALALLIEKKFAESAFFHTKTKHLSWNRWIYEPMGAKHQKLLLGNNAPGKCLHAHMQHFFSPSPARGEKFAESAFFHTKIKNLSWNRWIYEPMGAKHKKLLVGNNAPGKCLQHAFTPTCNASAFFQQHLAEPMLTEKIRWGKSAFFHTKIKNKNQTPVMKPLNLRANRGKTPKTTPGDNAPGNCPNATFLQH